MSDEIRIFAFLTDCKCLIETVDVSCFNSVSIMIPSKMSEKSSFLSLYRSFNGTREAWGITAYPIYNNVPNALGMHASRKGWLHSFSLSPMLVQLRLARIVKISIMKLVTSPLLLLLISQHRKLRKFSLHVQFNLNLTSSQVMNDAIC